jgi:hypothetical protein
MNATVKPAKQWRMVLSQNHSLLITILSCLILVGLIAFQVTSNKEPQRYYKVTAWSPQMAKGFFDGCTYTALRPGSGISDGAAKMYCGCDIDALQTIYKNDSQIAQAQKNWVKTGYTNAVISAMRKCATKAGIPLNI